VRALGAAGRLAHPGMWETPQESARRERAQRVVDDAEPAVRAYARRHRDGYAGCWVEWNDNMPRWVLAFTGDVERHAGALDRLGVRVAKHRRSLRALEALTDELFAADPPAGAVWSSAGVLEDHNVVEVLAMGPDEAAVAEWLADRYGDAVRLRWLGSSEPEIGPVPWHVWRPSADDRVVTVRYRTNSAYTFDHAEAQESADAVRITVFESQPRGFITMAAQDRSADVRLREPVGARRVIDTATGRVRPRH